MSMLVLDAVPVADGYAARRAVALSNARHFRRLAWLALRDGLPGADMRAVNARRAARIVLAGAKREAKRFRTVRDLLASDA